MVKIQMQDTIQSLTETSYATYCNFVKSYIPKNVSIHGCGNVDNVFDAD